MQPDTRRGRFRPALPHVQAAWWRPKGRLGRAFAFVAMRGTGPYDGFLAWPDATVTDDGRVRRCLGLLYVHLAPRLRDHLCWFVQLPYRSKTTLEESLKEVGGWDDGLLVSRAVGALQEISHDRKETP